MFAVKHLSDDVDVETIAVKANPPYLNACLDSARYHETGRRNENTIRDRASSCDKAAGVAVHSCCRDRWPKTYRSLDHS